MEYTAEQKQEILKQERNARISQGTLEGDSLSSTPFTTQGTRRGFTQSVGEWSWSPEVRAAHDLVLDYLTEKREVQNGLLAFGANSDDDPAEMMRDNISRIMKVFADAGSMKEAPEDVKNAAAFLQTSFDRSELRGKGEWFEAIGDYTVDVFTSPETLIGGLGALSAKGVGKLGGVIANKQASKYLASKGVNMDKVYSRVGLPVVDGALAGASDVAYQNYSMAVDLQDEYNAGQTLAFTAAGIGATVGLQKLTDKLKSVRADGAKSLTEISESPVVQEAQLYNEIDEYYPASGLHPYTSTAEAPLTAIYMDDVVELNTPRPLTQPEKNFQDLKVLEGVREELADDIDLVQNFSPEVKYPLLSELTAQTSLVVDDIKTVSDKVLKDLDNIKDLELHTKMLDDVLQDMELTDSLDGTVKQSIAAAMSEEAERLSTKVKSLMAEIGADTPIQAWEKKSADYSKLSDPSLKEAITAQADVQDLKNFMLYETSALAQRLAPAVKGRTASEIAATPDIQKMVADHGLGETTLNKIAGDIALEPDKTPKKLGGVLYRNLSTLSSTYMGGKQAGFLSPYRDVSPTAAWLQESISHEFGKQWKGPQKKIAADLFETYQLYSGGWTAEYMRAVEPVAKAGTKNTLEGKLTDEMNQKLQKAIRGAPTGDKTANAVGIRLKDIYSRIGDRLVELGLIDEKIPNYVHRMWHREAILNNREKFESLLVKHGQAPDLETAQAVTDGMLDKANHLDTSQRGSHFFNRKRVFTEIEDDSDFAEFFEQDIRLTMHHYIHQSSKAIAKMEKLGVRNLEEFQSKIATRILREVKENAPKDVLTRRNYDALNKQLIELYQTVTSEGVARYSPGATSLVEGYQLATRVSLLGMSTVTSLTEVLLNIPKAGFRNSIKGFNSASRAAWKTVTGDLEATLQHDFGLTAREAKRELFEYSLAVDHGLMSVSNRLVGDGLEGERVSKANSRFFKLVLLDQWTKFMQRTSFVTGKQLIYNNIKDIAAEGGQITTKRLQAKADELAELNIDVVEGLKWFKRGARTDDQFYNLLKRGAARYSNEVILNPTAMSGLKPRLLSNPRTAFMYQLLSYPTAFSNTVLKSLAKKISRDRSPETMARTAAAALIMTEVARLANYMRSEGRSAENGVAEEYYNAVKRWGGLTFIGDQIDNAHQSAKYIGNPSPYVFIPFGVFGSDIQTLANQGPATLIGQRLHPGLTIQYPGASENRKEYRAFLREVDKALTPDKEKSNKVY